MHAYYAELVDAYPIVSLEDPLDEADWAGFAAMTAAIGDKVQIVGDDIFVTNPSQLARGIAERHGQLAAGQAQPDRLAHRDPRRGRPGPPQRLHLHGQPPVR